MRATPNEGSMHLFWKGSAQVSPHRSDRTLIQNFAAPAPRQGARLDASKRGQILIKSVSNASGSRTCLISAQAKISVIPSAARTAMARRGRVEGLAVVSGDRGSGRNRVPVDGAQARKPRPTLQLVRRNEHPCLSNRRCHPEPGALCRAKDLGAPCERLAFFASVRREC